MNQTPSKIKQLNFKVPEEFYWKLKSFSSLKRLKMGELFENSFQFYQKRETLINEINTYRQTIQSIEKQMQTFQGKMSLLELRLKANNLNPVLFQKIGLVITYQILREVLEDYLRVSKRLEENMRTAPKGNLG